MQVESIQRSAAGFIVVSYITRTCLIISGASLANTNAVFTSLSVGSILLVLMLYKYIKTRRLVSGNHRRGRWWASDGTKSQNETVSGNSTVDTYQPTSRKSIYDRALVTRFTIGFVILAYVTL